VYKFSFPAPTRTLALSSVIGGRKICGTVSELRDGVEHKFSDLPRDEARLVLGSYFLGLLACWQVLDGGRLLSFLFCSLALVH
jgi:hypothetical protein